MIDSSTLDAAERPSGVLLSEARCIRWLQSGLNYFLHRFPWAGTVTSTSLTLSTQKIAFPTDFVLDVRDGLTISTANGGAGRLRRRSLQDIIGLSIEGDTGTPLLYAVQDPNLFLYPTPDKSYTATLWYYKLPVSLGPTTKPTFPDDWTLIEYIRLRGLEWVRELPPGTALEYAKKACGDLLKTGIGREPEHSDLHLDSRHFGYTGRREVWSWMGDR